MTRPQTGTGVKCVPLSHLLRCLVPSFPFRLSSLLFRSSRVDVGLRIERPPPEAMAALARGRTMSSSSGMTRGEPVPRARGETWRDASADTVHASMSMGVVLVGAGRNGRGVDGARGSRTGGGGTALYCPGDIVYVLKGEGCLGSLGYRCDGCALPSGEQLEITRGPVPQGSWRGRRWNERRGLARDKRT